MVDQTLTPTYFRPGAPLQHDGIVSSGPFNDGKEEWVLLDGTPASCVHIGLYHEFKDRGPVDLVISGPNYGRNTTATFVLSSGTIGGALEGAMCGKKAIALSYAFDSREHDPDIIAKASRLSMRLAEKLVEEWPDDVHLYSINVPVRKGVENQKIVYTDVLQNTWLSGSSYDEIMVDDEDKVQVNPTDREKEIREGSNADTVNAEMNGDAEKQVTRRQQKRYKWAPRFGDMKEAAEKSGKGDGWTVLQGMIR